MCEYTTNMGVFFHYPECELYTKVEKLHIRTLLPHLPATLDYFKRRTFLTGMMINWVRRDEAIINGNDIDPIALFKSVILWNLYKPIAKNSMTAEEYEYEEKFFAGLWELVCEYTLGYITPMIPLPSTLDEIEQYRTTTFDPMDFVIPKYAEDYLLFALAHDIDCKTKQQFIEKVGLGLYAHSALIPRKRTREKNRRTFYLNEPLRALFIFIFNCYYLDFKKEPAPKPVYWRYAAETAFKKFLLIKHKELTRKFNNRIRLDTKAAMTTTHSFKVSKKPCTVVQNMDNEPIIQQEPENTFYGHNLDSWDF